MALLIVDEMIIDNYNVTTQSSSLQYFNFNVTIPSDASCDGQTFLRFRYDENMISSPTGAGRRWRGRRL